MRRRAEATQFARKASGSLPEKCHGCNHADVQYDTLCGACFFSRYGNPPCFGGPVNAHLAYGPGTSPVDTEQRRADVEAIVERRKKRVRTFQLWPPRVGAASD